MRTKPVTIKIEIEIGYKWLARQPFGTWVLFKNKPKIHVAYQDQESDGFIPSYWASQKDEIELCHNGPQGGNWKESLRKVG